MDFLDWRLPIHLSNVELLHEQHCEFIQRHLPHFPRDVIESWLVRHGRQVIPEWGWISFPDVRFSREVWSIDRIREIRDRDGKELGGYGRLLQTHPEDFVVAFVLAHRTWSVPIIVVDNSDGRLPRGQIDHEGLVLVEGYHRLDYVRALSNPKPDHEVFLMKVEHQELNQR